MTRITIDALKAGTSRTVEVPVADLGGSVLLRSITRAELNDIREECGFVIDDDGSMRIEDPNRFDILILLAAWEEPSLADIEDPEAVLGLQPAGLIRELTREAFKVSGMTKEARFLDRAKDDDGP